MREEEKQSDMPISRRRSKQLTLIKLPRSIAKMWYQRKGTYYQLLPHLLKDPLPDTPLRSFQLYRPVCLGQEKGAGVFYEFPYWIIGFIKALPYLDCSCCRHYSSNESGLWHQLKTLIICVLDKLLRSP